MSSPEEQSSEYESQEIATSAIVTKIEFLYKQVQNVYYNRYYWEVFKSMILFALGLKISHECYHIVIPIKEYTPFQGFCARCR